MPSKKNRILIAKEKHGTRYFDARTDKAMHSAALRLVKERTDPEYGYITDPGPLEEWVKRETNFTDEQILALPESFKKEALAKRRRYQQEVRTWSEFNNDYLEAKKAVKTKDGKLAFEILMRRADHEYEGVRVEYLE